MTTSQSGVKKLFLLDGYALLYRAHFAFIRNPLITSYGLPTSALFGFINQVFRLLQSEQPDYLAAVFDAKEKTFRHERYPEYKATREKMPEELVEQLPHLWQLLEAMNIVTLIKPGYEADDIIGTLAKQSAEHDMDVYIVSGDKDFMQLVNDHVFLYTTSHRTQEPVIVDRQGVIDKWGVPPEKIIDLLGLMGDSSDNVPGVRGVGEKSAVKLIHEFGSLENALDNAELVTNKRVKSGLLECREQALLSRELVTIDTGMELDYAIPEMTRSAFNFDELENLFRRLEFSGLVRQLENFRGALPTPEIHKDYRTISTPDDLQAFVTQIPPDDFLSIDLETTSVDPMRARIVGLSFSCRPDSGVYIPVDYLDKTGNNFAEDDLRYVLEAVRPLLENPAVRKTGQNIKYDALVLKRHGIEVRGIAFDTMIAAHLIKPELRSYKLDNLSREYLNYTMVPITDLIGSGRNQITFDQVDLDRAAFYAAEDADIAGQLTPLFRKELAAAGLEEFYNRIELPLIPVLTRMENAGVYVDPDMLAEMSVEFSRRLDLLVLAIHNTAGTEFNINSTQQLAQILFDQIGLRPVRKRSTAENVLEALKNEHPLPALMLEYRKLAKLKSTYLDALVELVHPETGRIHSTFNQTIAATGRLSSTNPNFQNIPIRREEGREIRKAFRAQRPGWRILAADYSQIELRIMAHLSGDPGLIEAFNRGEDIHTRTASLVFGVAPEDVLPEMRRTAKIVNFGIMYGAGPFRMSQELGLPREEARHLIDTYFRQYAGIRDYIERTLEQARTDRYVETVLGRRRPVWDAVSSNRNQREAAERMAINMPIQGTAAEMIKLAMIRIDGEILRRGLEAQMILQVHDELLFEVPENELDELRSLVLAEMENALPLNVPVVVDCGVGNTWFDA
ncbi:MAG: DNA polymerase I, partial [Candidatus Neomarinimicrobiota bacterium]